jgi:uncharacterized protein (TIGR00369 family)
MIEKITKKIVFKIIKERFVKEVPFLKLLSIKVSKFDYPEVEMVLNWNNLLMGNVVQESLHGGVTATMLDSVGGLVAVGSFISTEKNLTADYLKTRIGRMGTIDMRVDYLLPGRGTMFTATGRVIRAGKRVTVCRMEMHNDKNDCIALGTGSYLWSDKKDHDQN